MRIETNRKHSACNSVACTRKFLQMCMNLYPISFQATNGFSRKLKARWNFW